MRASRHTTDYRLVPFITEHADDLWKRPGPLAYAERGAGMKRELVARMAQLGHSFSLLTNGHLVASGGVYPIWEGMGEAWFIGSELVKPHRRRVVMQLREHIDELTTDNNYKRVQATARTDFKVAQRFLEFLGFEREGLMRRYGPDGADHYLYARLM